MHPSYYGIQPRVIAVVPFTVNEELAQQIRQRGRMQRVNAPVLSAALTQGHSEHTEARLQRFRDRLASRLRAGEALPEPASKAARGEGGEALRARAEALRVSEEAPLKPCSWAPCEQSSLRAKQPGRSLESPGSYWEILGSKEVMQQPRQQHQQRNERTIRNMPVAGLLPSTAASERAAPWSWGIPRQRRRASV